MHFCLNGGKFYTAALGIISGIPQYKTYISRLKYIPLSLSIKYRGGAMKFREYKANFSRGKS